MKNLMDFDIGNLFYIIATILAILVGVLGKKKKPAGVSPSDSQKQSGNQGLFDVLGREFGVYTEPVYEEEKYDPGIVGIPDSPISEEKKPSAPEPVADIFRNYEEGLSSPEMDMNRILLDKEGVSATSMIQVIDLDQEKRRDFNEILDHFDAETAVIYSAIINRIDY